ncbi:hypothetical protein AgCh_001621 [Apium graveolens]
MKEVTFNNVKCKIGGSIPRKGDARTSMLSLPNQERKADDHCYLLEAIWIDLNLNKDAIMKLGIDYRGGNDEYDNLSRKYDLIYSWKDAGKAKEVADTLKDEVVERKMLGPAVVQRTRDIIDLIRGRLVVTQDGHKRKCNSDARQIGAYERIDMQPDVTYMEQPGRIKLVGGSLRLPSNLTPPKEGLDCGFSVENLGDYGLMCPSTREGPGNGLARGPNAARVMTGSPLLSSFITQQQLGKMARLQQTQRKRVGSVPRLPDDVVAAIAAEVDLLVDQAFYF